MSRKELNKIEDNERFEDNYNDLPPSDIVAFNELRSCADLLRLYLNGLLEISPDFQREVVWKQPDQSRFIDSLTKQLPIPSMCISIDYKTEKRIVIDGTQRMTSIINFLSDPNWQLSNLEDIDTRLSGKTSKTIELASPELVERVRNVMIPITIIRCDYSKRNHNEYLFTIFKRLNSGGTKLNNQEIRNCIYNGPFNTLLKNVANSAATVKIIGKKSRFANEELILRFFAFQENLDSYDGRLSKFLNDYMSELRNPDLEVLDKLWHMFDKVITFITIKSELIGDIKQFGKTVLEGILYGVAKNIDDLKKLDDKKIKALFKNFHQLPEFQVESLKEGLGKKDRVVERLNAAELHFFQSNGF